MYIYIYIILQYLQDSGHNGENKKNYENYLRIGSCTSCGKMTIKKTTFKGAHNLNCEIFN